MSIGQAMKHIRGIVLIAFAVAAQAQQAQTYEVAGCEFLNMREGPASTHPVKQRLQSGAHGIVLIGKPVFNGATKWQQVNSRGVIGWVNVYYLKESIQPLPSATPNPVRGAIAVEQPTPQPIVTPTPIVINEHGTEPIPTTTPAFTLINKPAVEDLLLPAVIIAFALGFLYLIFLFIRKKAERRLIQRINQATNAVKIGRYSRLVRRYRELHELDFAGYLAAAVTNEAFSDPPSNDQGREFLGRNRALIEQELFALAKDMDIRRVLTETIRARGLVPFIQGQTAETWLNRIEKLQHFGILIPGGDAPSAEVLFYDCCRVL
jgi:hypothetical protein